MKTFFIIANNQKDPKLENAKRIRSYLEERGCTCYLQDSSDEEECGTYRYTNPASIPDDTECVLVLGGDGTLLQAARDLIDRGLPLFGVNLGTLGYLAEIDMQGSEEAAQRLADDQFTLENRMMLSGAVTRNGRELLRDRALNDIVIVRRGHLRVVDFNIYVDDVFLCAYRADGIIISTATGSTGYSLSAGGPIVAPDASLLLLTAIAPHTLNSRPVILPDNVEITVEVGAAHAGIEGAEVTFDGDTALTVTPGDRITVTKAEKQTRLVKINNTSFVEILRKKMN